MVRLATGPILNISNDSGASGLGDRRLSQRKHHQKVAWLNRRHAQPTRLGEESSVEEIGATCMTATGKVSQVTSFGEKAAKDALGNARYSAYPAIRDELAGDSLVGCGNAIGVRPPRYLGHSLISFNSFKRSGCRRGKQDGIGIDLGRLHFRAGLRVKVASWCQSRITQALAGIAFSALGIAHDEQRMARVP